jgi:hypothetical protein
VPSKNCPRMKAGEESEDDTETQVAKQQRRQRTAHVSPALIANQSYWENAVAEGCLGKKKTEI